MRILHLNAGDIHPGGDYSEFSPLLTNMTRTEANTYSTNEQNLDVAQPGIKGALINKDKCLEKYRAHCFSSSKDVYPRTYTSDGRPS